VARPALVPIRWQAPTETVGAQHFPAATAAVVEMVMTPRVTSQRPRAPGAAMVAPVVPAGRTAMVAQVALAAAVRRA
jgi:hypothetical protein